MLVIFMASGASAVGQTASTSAWGMGWCESGILKYLPQLLGGEKHDGILKEPSDAEKAADAQKIEEKIDKASGWFKETTGLGLDEIARAAWKFFLWLVRTAVEWAWALVAWLSEAIRS